MRVRTSGAVAMKDSFETIELRRDGPISIIVLNRPRRLNAINQAMLDELQHVEPAAIKLARHIAVIDPMLVKRSKRAINRTFEIMGMMEALEASLDIDLAIEGQGSEDKRHFMEIARTDGLRAAFAWRDARFR
jgi:enoyl-CoA hydratase